MFIIFILFHNINGSLLEIFQEGILYTLYFIVHGIKQFEKPCVNSPYRMLMSEMGMTKMPTSMSATARERRKKFVAFCSFFSSDTARITKIFPPIVRKIITRISRAGQFFSFITSLSTP